MNSNVHSMSIQKSNITSSSNLLQFCIDFIKYVFEYVFGGQSETNTNLSLIEKDLKEKIHHRIITKEKSLKSPCSPNVLLLNNVKKKKIKKYTNNSIEELAGPSQIIKKRRVGGSNLDFAKTSNNNNNKTISFNFNSAFKLRNNSHGSHESLTKTLIQSAYNPNGKKKLVDKFVTLLANAYIPIEEMSWDKYHHWPTIKNYLYLITRTYTNLVTLKTIGTTYEKRQIIVVKISESNSKKNNIIFVEGGIHAREWISPATATYCIDYLLKNWLHLPKYIKNKTWIFLPVANPDGYSYSWTRDRQWRKNRKIHRRIATWSLQCVGVDLNRNFDAGWENNPFDDPCLNNYKGTRPFSENESQAIRDFLLPLKVYLKGYISLHSFGQEIRFYWNLDEQIKDEERVREIAELGVKNMRKINHMVYSIKPSAKKFLFGSSRDWARKCLDIKYAYVMELRDRGRYGFLLRERDIIPNAKEVFEFLSTVAWAIDDDIQKANKKVYLKMWENEKRRRNLKVENGGGVDINTTSWPTNSIRTGPTTSTTISRKTRPWFTI